jgi:hypothetical protein
VKEKRPGPRSSQSFKGVPFGLALGHNSWSFEGLDKAKGPSPELELKGEFGPRFWPRVTWRTLLAYKDPHRLGFT